MSDHLKTEKEFFDRIRAKLQETFGGQFAVIMNEEVLGTYSGFLRQMPLPILNTSMEQY